MVDLSHQFFVCLYTRPGKSPNVSIFSGPGHRWTDALHNGRVRSRVGEGQVTSAAAELLAIDLG